jgi:pimeloyl-ACP methyl ester carboxylesterase
MGIYRAAFTSIAQTEPLMKVKTTVPVMAMGGVTGGLGAKVGEMVKMVAEHVEVVTLPGGGHFLPEECPDEVAHRILVVAADLRSRSQLSKEKII